MSKGSAGKVYFVLYLAVILELLIIIVERDEAEDHLRKREREAREIIQDILGQMQVGPGNENLTSRINDEISLVSDEAVKISGIPYKKYRFYNIEVGVNDGSSALMAANGADTAQTLALLKHLTNAEHLRYEILFLQNDATDVPAQDAAWRSVGAMELVLDTASTLAWKAPAYKAENEAACKTYSANTAGAVFSYNAVETDKLAEEKGGRYLKRIFTTNFQPTQAGWYKLRYTSRTNRIMGVGGDAASFDEVSDESKVNIGAMQLTVKKLRKVQKMLERELESYNVPQMNTLIAAKNEEEAAKFFALLDSAKSALKRERSGESDGALVQDIVRKIDVYGDMAKLLAPNKSRYFAQNSGAMEINIRVTKPPVAIVKANVALPQNVYLFDKLTPKFTFTAGPFYGNNFPKGEIVDANGASTPLVIERATETRPMLASAEKTNADVKMVKALNASSDAGNTLDKGKAVEFTAKAVQVLKAGSYTVRIKHSSQGDETVQETKLSIFPSQLTAQNRRSLEGRMKSMFYGGTLSVNLEPDCAGAVPPSEFRTFIGLSTGLPTLTPSVGLQAKQPLEAKAKLVAVRCTWTSPFTGEEVEILPKLEQPIKQREPDIDLTKAAVTGVEGEWRELKIAVGGLQLSAGVIDVGSKYGTPENLDNISLVNARLENAQDVELIDSQLKEQGNGLYSAVFTVRSLLLKQPKEMTGAITFGINAAMRNPVNGTRSGAVSMETSVPFMYAPPPIKGKKK
ncbi:MAG: hypothetical protein EAZ92_11560 [Candidatus Kapaibacterium sp.]|nr:MAG: hypothetical protein EAZ92_11560 [Candidatus Kapabacteria bacterium]